MIVLISNSAAILSGILIPISFIIYADWVKKKAYVKIMNLIKNNHLLLKIQAFYREEELKFFLPYSIIYLLSLFLVLYLIAPYMNFDLLKIYFSSETNKPLSEKIIKTLLILFIIFILYSGLLIQIFLGIESIHEKTKWCFFMENIYMPLFEEIIYRGILYTIFIYAGYNGILSSIFSSLTFSLSHFRHIFDKYYTSDQLPHLFFQSFYTLLFGFYTCYAYEYAGTIFAPGFLHMVCNTLQMPRFGFLRDNRISPKMKLLINATYVIGIAGWIVMIFLFH